MDGDALCVGVNQFMWEVKYVAMKVVCWETSLLFSTVIVEHDTTLFGEALFMGVVLI